MFSWASISSSRSSRSPSFLFEISVSTKFCNLTGPLRVPPKPPYNVAIAAFGFRLRLSVLRARVELLPRPRSSCVMMRWLLLKRVKLLLTYYNWLWLEEPFRSGCGCCFDSIGLPTTTGRKEDKREGLATTTALAESEEGCYDAGVVERDGGRDTLGACFTSDWRADGGELASLDNFSHELPSIGGRG